jgi:hypothetical protein
MQAQVRRGRIRRSVATSEAQEEQACNSGEGMRAFLTTTHFEEYYTVLFSLHQKESSFCLARPHKHIDTQKFFELVVL